MCHSVTLTVTTDPLTIMVPWHHGQNHFNQLCSYVPVLLWLWWYLDTMVKITLTSTATQPLLHCNSTIVALQQYHCCTATVPLLHCNSAMVALYSSLDYTTVILLTIEGQFSGFRRFSSSKLVLKTVESCFVALDYCENGSILLWIILWVVCGHLTTVPACMNMHVYK